MTLTAQECLTSAKRINLDMLRAMERRMFDRELLCMADLLPFAELADMLADAEKALGAPARAQCVVHQIGRPDDEERQRTIFEQAELIEKQRNLIDRLSHPVPRLWRHFRAAGWFLLAITGAGLFFLGGLVEFLLF